MNRLPCWPPRWRGALLRRELRTDPAQIIGMVRDTVALMPAATRGVRVLLHPDDAALVRERPERGGSGTGMVHRWTIRRWRAVIAVCTPIMRRSTPGSIHASTKRWCCCWAKSAAHRAREKTHDGTAASGHAWAQQLQRSIRAATNLPPPPVEGQLSRMVGLTLEAAGCQAAIGDRCEVMASDGSSIEAEVVGFAGDRLFLMPAGDVHGVKPGARVIPRPGAGFVRVGPELLGRVIDASGAPLDGRGPIYAEDRARPCRRADESAAARAHRTHPRCGRARHQCIAHRGPWPAHRPCLQARAWARACCWA